MLSYLEERGCEHADWNIPGMRSIPVCSYCSIMSVYEQDRSVDLLAKVIAVLAAAST